MQTIILASGRGSRFRPVTDYLPKPLLPAANRPLLDYLLATVTAVGVRDIYVTMGYAGEQIQQYLTNARLDQAITGVPAPKWEQGPLASLQSVLPYLSKTDPCLLLPGDLFISQTALRLLFASSAEVSLLYDPLAMRPGTLLQLNSSNHIQKLTQVPAYLPGFHSVLPAIRVTPAFFTSSRASSPNRALTVFDLLQIWIAQNQPIEVIPVMNEVWFDIDTPANLIELNHHLLTTGWPPHPIPPGTYIPPHTSVDGPVQSATLTLGQDSIIEGPVLLGAHVHIDDGTKICAGTSLGEHTTVGSNSELTRCITLPHTQVPSNAILTATILDANGNALH